MSEMCILVGEALHGGAAREIEGGFREGARGEEEVFNGIMKTINE